MLPSSNRLRSDKKIRYLLRYGKKIWSRSFSLIYLDNPENIAPQFTVIVSKRISKKAVTRNTIKRLLTECIRQEFLTGIPVGISAVIIVKSEIIGLNYQELKKELALVFKKIG